MSFYDLDKSSKKERAAQLIDKDPDGNKQLEKVSPHSPSPVHDNEILARSLEYPTKFHAQGGLNDSFFGDAQTHGASAQRAINGWHAHQEEIHTRFESRAAARRKGSDVKSPSPEFTYVGSFHITAKELRNFRINDIDKMRIRVYDAGNDPSDPLHAEIIADTSGLHREQRHLLRVLLMKLAEKRGLHISPFLNEAGKQIAQSCGCNLINPAPNLPTEAQNGRPCENTNSQTNLQNVAKSNLHKYLRTE